MEDLGNDLFFAIFLLDVIDDYSRKNVWSFEKN